ncbi:lmo0937 family membrane protein [Pradoshia sp.]
MLWTIIGIILAVWLLGFLFDIAGNLIHILLAVAAIVFVINIIKGRGSGV